MTIYSLQGQLAPTRDAAVAAAIGAATADFKDLAPSMVIHVINVLEMRGGWKAVVRVSLEPSIDIKAQEKPAPPLAPAPDDDPVEVHYAKIHTLSPELDTGAYELAMPPEPPVYIYIPSLLEPGDLYKPHHYDAHPNYHFHFLDPDSSLWKASFNVHPHLDLMVSWLELDKSALVPTLENIRKPKGLSLGLTDEM